MATTFANPNRRQVLNEEKEDRISYLPPDLLTKILSHLTVDEAVSTSLLSKTWRYHWTSITNLQFYFDLIPPPSKQLSLHFINFVNRILPLIHSCSIHKFSLYYRGFNALYHIRKWISDATTRNVKEIYLDLEIEKELPTSVIYCKTLEILKLYMQLYMPCSFNISSASSINCFPNLKILVLSNVHLGEFPLKKGLICFPALKTLCLYEVIDKKYGMRNLLRNCPLLQHLEILIYKNEDIYYLPYVRKNMHKFQIHVPMLQHLSISGWNLANELVIKHSNSLTKAELNCKMDRYHARELITTVEKVQNLSLSCHTVEAIKVGIASLPLFCNLIWLEVEFNCEELSVLQRLLENSILLKCLVIRKGGRLDSCGRGPRGKMWYPKLGSVPLCFITSLKIVKFRRGNGCTGDVALIKYLLKNAKVLEKLAIETRFMKLTHRSQLHEMISLLPRGSADCEIALSLSL